MAFPKDMFKPAPEKPISVKDEREYEEALRKGYSETYIHQAYPTTVYGKTHTTLQPDALEVANPDEHKAAHADGYLDAPPDLKPSTKSRPPPPK
jgi:hypothetical protein